MAIGKMVAAGVMALATVAFCAPAAQAEPEWYVEGATLEGEAGFEAEGEISSVRGFTTGPGVVSLEGTLSNSEGMASGTISGAAIAGEGEVFLSTTLPGCKATGTINKASLPWSVTGTTNFTGSGAANTVGISGATIVLHYFENGVAGGCPKFGVPSKIEVDGTVTGKATGNEEETCIDLNNHLDDMFIEVGKVTTSLQFDLTSQAPICIGGLELK